MCCFELKLGFYASTLWIGLDYLGTYNMRRDLEVQNGHLYV